MALNEVMKCSQCMILITSKLHFVLHIKEVHGGKTLAPLPPSPQGSLLNGHTTKAPQQVSSEEKDTACMPNNTFFHRNWLSVSKLYIKQLGLKDTL